MYLVTLCYVYAKDHAYPVQNGIVYKNTGTHLQVTFPLFFSEHKSLVSYKVCRNRCTVSDHTIPLAPNFFMKISRSIMFSLRELFVSCL